jgi:hypothetical protein
VCASVTASSLRELDVPEDLAVIEDRILDRGIEMLGRMLRQLPRIAQGTE